MFPMNNTFNSPFAPQKYGSKYQTQPSTSGSDSSSKKVGGICLYDRSTFWGVEEGRSFFKTWSAASHVLTEFIVVAMVTLVTLMLGQAYDPTTSPLAAAAPGALIYGICLMMFPSGFFIPSMAIMALLRPIAPVSVDKGQLSRPKTDDMSINSSTVKDSVSKSSLTAPIMHAGPTKSKGGKDESINSVAERVMDHQKMFWTFGFIRIIFDLAAEIGGSILSSYLVWQLVQTNGNDPTVRFVNHIRYNSDNAGVVFVVVFIANSMFAFVHNMLSLYNCATINCQSVLTPHSRTSVAINVAAYYLISAAAAEVVGFSALNALTSLGPSVVHGESPAYWGWYFFAQLAAWFVSNCGFYIYFQYHRTCSGCENMKQVAALPSSG